MDIITTERRGTCLIVAAPSGAGKSTLTAALLEANSDLTLSISVTTRPPRPGEMDGVHYLFRSAHEFAEMVRAGDMLEYASVFGNSYGTPRQPVEQALSLGRDVIFDVDWQGYRQIKAALPDDTVGLFIMPPSLAALSARLTHRAGDDADEIGRRMAGALGEISHWEEFDYVVVNDCLSRCIAQAQSVLTAARCTTGRSIGVRRFVGGLGGEG